MKKPRGPDLALRVGFLLITLCISLLTLSFALKIGKFEMIFADMMQGKPLPVLTRYVVNYKSLFIGLSIFLPLCAGVSAFKIRRPVLVVWVVLGIGALLLGLLVLIYSGVMAPLFQILYSLGYERDLAIIGP